MNIITTINVSNHMITSPKNIDSRLNSNEPRELIKSGQDYSSIRMQLVWTQPIISKNFSHKPLKREGILH
jgi:hypothetical protein